MSSSLSFHSTRSLERQSLDSQAVDDSLINKRSDQQAKSQKTEDATSSLPGRSIRWRNSGKRIGAFGLLFLSAGVSTHCIPEFQDDLAHLETRRVLAVRAEPAEASPGSTVQLSALIATPDGTVQEAEFEWGLCIARKPLTELGPVSPVCLEGFEQESPGVVHLGTGLQVEATIPSNACDQFGPLQPPAKPGETPGRPVDPDLTGGFYQPVLIQDQELGLASVRILCGPIGLPQTEVVRFNQQYKRNENPQIQKLEARLGDQELEWSEEKGKLHLNVPAGASVTFRAHWEPCPESPVCGDGYCTGDETLASCAEDCAEPFRTCPGAEYYPWADSENRVVQIVRESISVAWFAPAGSWDNEQTGILATDAEETHSANTWTAPSQAGKVPAWVIIRDDRGGNNWQEFFIEVTAP